MSKISGMWFGLIVSMNALSMAVTSQWYWRLINFSLCTLLVWERARRYEALNQRRIYEKVIYPIAREQLEKAITERIALRGE